MLTSKRALHAVNFWRALIVVHVNAAFVLQVSIEILLVENHDYVGIPLVEGLPQFCSKSVVNESISLYAGPRIRPFGGLSKRACGLLLLAGAHLKNALVKGCALLS